MLIKRKSKNKHALGLSVLSLFLTVGYVIAGE